MDLERYRQKLEQERAKLLALSEGASDSRRPVMLDQQSVGRLSRQDALQQQAMANAQEQLRRRDLLRIDRALKRIEQGTYGLCLNCEEDIAEKRLEIDPAVELCLECRS